MKTDLILAGVGGQGILSIAAAIGMAAMQDNLHFKQSEVHGMSQRGGAVQSHMRLSSNPIYSDLVPMGGSDLIVAVEPLESLRYLPYLKESGWLVTNLAPFKNIDNYPDEEKILDAVKGHKNHVLVDADAIAKELNSPKSSNMVIMGAASPFIEISQEMFEKGITEIFKNKGEEMVKVNLEAFRRGRTIAEEARK